MPSTRTSRNARRAVASVRAKGGPVKGGGSTDNSGKAGKVGAGPRLRARFAAQINQQAGREARKR